MDYKEFENRVMEALKEKLGCGYRVESGSPGECGRPTGRSILIGRQGVNASMIVRMDEYYTKDMHGTARKEGIAQAVSEILDVCRGRIPDCDIDVSKFADWDSIKTHIRARLVNTESNQGHLEKAPHRDFLDLSLEYYADMPGATQAGRPPSQSGMGICCTRGWMRGRFTRQPWKTWRMQTTWHLSAWMSCSRHAGMRSRRRRKSC